MFAARLTLSNRSPIRAVRQALNSLESALPRNPTWHFVKPIESTRISRISPFCTKCASVTRAFATLTKHTPRNPCRMNTSTKHTGPLPLQIRQLIHTKQLTPGSASRGQTTLRTFSPLFVLTSLPYYFRSVSFSQLCYIFKSMPDPNSSTLPSREEAWKLLCEYTQSESLRKHMLAVETCVRAYARKQGADEALWGLTALLHDFDYERFPNNAHAPDAEHPAEGIKILGQHGYPEEMLRAILSHADYCNVPRQTPLEHTLFACDELAGFLVACTYVRPSKSILDLEPDSVKKRLKDKAFARGVNREDVRKGAEELGIPIEEHIAFCIKALRENVDALGLRGSL